MEISKMKIDVFYHKIEAGIVEEIKIGNDIYRLVHPGDEKRIEEKKEEKESFAANEKTEQKLDVKPTSKKDKILGQSKGYGINILRSQVEAVLDSLKRGNKTLASITEDTGMVRYRVQGILNWLRGKSIIRWKCGKHRRYTFHIVKKDWKP